MLDQMQDEAQRSQVMVKVNQVKSDVFLFRINDHTSSLRKQLRVSVFVLRYIKLKLWVRIPEERIRNYFKNRLLKAVFHGLQKKGPITTREIHLACLLWVWFVQLCSFSDLFCALKKIKITVQRASLE